MSYTQEQLKGMSDSEVELRVSRIMGLAWRGQRNYCNDWSLTGPLMVEYGVIIIYTSEGKYQLCESSKDCEVSSSNPNPLRAVCEIILMMEEV